MRPAPLDAPGQPVEEFSARSAGPAPDRAVPMRASAVPVRSSRPHALREHLDRPDSIVDRWPQNLFVDLGGEAAPECARLVDRISAGNKYSRITKGAVRPERSFAGLHQTPVSVEGPATGRARAPSTRFTDARSWRVPGPGSGPEFGAQVPGQPGNHGAGPSKVCEVQAQSLLA